MATNAIVIATFLRSRRSVFTPYWESTLMRELVNEDQFIEAYARQHGEVPQSYYYSHDEEVEGALVTSIEMGFFLGRGEIWADESWRQVTYHIPQESQGEALAMMLDLGTTFPVQLSVVQDEGGNVTGETMRLVGSHTDERGTAVVEGILREPGKVQEVVYTRYQPEDMVVLNMPPAPTRGRRDGFN